MFAVGDMVAYPMHGAGVIEGIEEKEILGQVKQYYVLRFSVGGMKVMVPVEGVQDAGLRPIITLEESNTVLEFLSGACEDECSNWNRRYRENLEKIKTGKVYEVAEVVKSLTHRDREKGLSTGEKKMLGNARQILASELVLSLGKDEEEVLVLIEQAV